MSERDPYAFLSPAAASAGVGLRTPMERSHLAAGATISEHDGWRVAAYEQAERRRVGVRSEPPRQARRARHRRRARRPHGWARAGRGAKRRRGVDDAADPDARLCAVPVFARGRRCARASARAAIDVTCGLAGVSLGGERRRDVFNRSSGLDVRASRFGPNRCMAGSVMRVPTIVLNRGEDLVMLVAWEVGEYFWEAILDAGETIGIARAGVVVREPQEATA